MPRPTIKPPKKSANQIIKLLVPDLRAEPNLKPSQFIQKYWSAYKNLPGKKSNSLNGNVFQELIAVTLIRSNIFPFYPQAKITFIPSADYDFLIFCGENKPIVLSLKVSIRERWKQADLEALSLRNIYRQAESYLISMSEKEISTRKKDIATKTVMALDGFILATTIEYDDLLARLSQLSPQEAPTFKTVESSFIITNKNYPQRYS